MAIGETGQIVLKCVAMMNQNKTPTHQDRERDTKRETNTQASNQCKREYKHL